MDFDKATNILNTLNDKRREMNKLLDIENKTIERDWCFVEIEHVRLEFSKSEVDQILDEKKKLLENEIRTLAKELLDEGDND
ncbi:hypothetical protein [Leuconostoc mesenteroides]|uniref:hypothetical protein n=1 Tax=Leuconostoc mesenteroides TaxID=1245 RepID=UPI000B8D40B0|nr:hypothetical protein [Leuconostoc mesenteroides]ASR69253.1 hypothetical protein CBW60_07745 [Leuconostoc mesenteroides]MCT3045910.1 hypothetical protein [Leuconostoc mesenteroides]